MKEGKIGKKILYPGRKLSDNSNLSINITKLIKKKEKNEGGWANTSIVRFSCSMQVSEV